MENAAPLLAGRYVLEEEISSGGMAAVWRARDDILARPVAVKILHPHLAQDEDFLTRFRREAVAAAGLVHPNIVSIFDTGSHGEAESATHYIVMEYCGAGTLASEVARSGALDPARAARYLRTICGALEYAHQRGVVHRDVKPANVLIASDGTLKVTDFGIAKAADMDGDVSTTGTILGTVAYISPERARGDEPGPRADIYALGVLGYELLTGAVPFTGDSHVATALMHLNDTPEALSARRAGIPRELERIVMRALEKDPDKRFASASDMARALEHAGAGPEEAPSPDDQATRAIPVPQRTSAGQGIPSLLGEVKWAIPLGIVVLVTIAIVVALVAAFSERQPVAQPEDPTPRPVQQRPIEIIDVADFDPFGDGAEHSTEVALVVDENDDTAWTTEDYNDPFGVLKPGVGLIFDLGSNAAVDGIDIASPDPGYSIEIRAANEAGTELQDYGVITRVEGATVEETLRFEPTSRRYWLLWITALPDVTGRATIGEVTFHGG